MSIFDIVLLGAALSMDAAAVGMANGMAEPRMSRQKTFLIALFFGVFQGGMPLLGYFGSSVFSSLVRRIAPYLSFMLLLFLGGKMLIDAASEEEERLLVRREGLRLPALTAQAVATSVDALAGKRYKDAVLLNQTRVDHTAAAQALAVAHNAAGAGDALDILHGNLYHELSLTEGPSLQPIILTEAPPSVVHAV